MPGVWLIALLGMMPAHGRDGHPNVEGSWNIVAFTAYATTGTAEFPHPERLAGTRLAFGRHLVTMGAARCKNELPLEVETGDFANFYQEMRIDPSVVKLPRHYQVVSSDCGQFLLRTPTSGYFLRGGYLFEVRKR